MVPLEDNVSASRLISVPGDRWTFTEEDSTLIVYNLQPLGLYTPEWRLRKSICSMTQAHWVLYRGKRFRKTAIIIIYYKTSSSLNALNSVYFVKCFENAYYCIHYKNGTFHRFQTPQWNTEAYIITNIFHFRFDLTREYVKVFWLCIFC